MDTVCGFAWHSLWVHPEHRFVGGGKQLRAGNEHSAASCMSEEKLTVWTVGHSTRTLDEFLDLLVANRIEAVADVRRYPASRKHPHFNQGPLRNALSGVGIGYVPLLELGGRRRPRADSPNTVWRSDSFRGYADYMETAAFGAGMGRLLEVAHRQRTAVMCAEALWWRCHRSLIADYLKAGGMGVQHLMSIKKSEIHPYTSAARLKHGRLSYSPDE